MLRHLNNQAIHHIDRCDSCCKNSWLSVSGMDKGCIDPQIDFHIVGGLKAIGWIETPKDKEFCPVAIVFECPECFTKWWTHYCWVGDLIIDHLSLEAKELLEKY